MLFPEDAKDAISSVFYDKSISVLSDTTEIDDEGGIVRTSSQTTSTFKGNVRFNALGELQNEIGLTHNIDIAITCPTDTAVAVNDLLQYAGIKYVATDVVPYDSHKLITGERWEKQ